MTEFREMGLEESLSDIVKHYGVDPNSRVGRKFKMKLIELYKRTPPGFHQEVIVRVLHDPKCASMGERADICSCDPDVTATLAGLENELTH